MLSAGNWLRSHDVLIVSLLVRIDMSRKKADNLFLDESDI
jgi:hypothetical protein